MDIIIYILIAILTFATGIFFSSFLAKNKKKMHINSMKEEGERIKKEKLLQAKEKLLQLKSDHEKYISERKARLSESITKFQQKESNLSRRIEDYHKDSKQLEILKKDLKSKLEHLAERNKELDKMREQVVKQLEVASGFSAKEAKEKLMESLKDKAQTDAMAYVNEMIEEAKLNAKKEATKVIVKSIQRLGTEIALENSVSVFNIESDEMKGRIIGREGRNIRALEAATGVQFIVDDTPEAILLSAFDPMRREIARLSLHQLVSDGRIHPARIEEVVEKITKKIEDEILETGKKTAIDLGIHGMRSDMMRLVGKMKYRSSYGQNLLQHSRETANLCAVMASELGLNPQLAKRAGLLHDIGKVADEDTEQPHAIAGMKLAEKYREKPEVCNAIGAHHEEIEMTSLISPVVLVCDAISGARPGARREIAESYIKRLKALESLALSYPGVLKTYAIQAGRELRVIVGSEEVSDKDINKLSYEIANKIQNEMTYPGQVKITVIRETRSTNYAT